MPFGGRGRAALSAAGIDHHFDAVLLAAGGIVGAVRLLIRRDRPALPTPWMLSRRLTGAVRTAAAPLSSDSDATKGFLLLQRGLPPGRAAVQVGLSQWLRGTHRNRAPIGPNRRPSRARMIALSRHAADGAAQTERPPARCELTRMVDLPHALPDVVASRRAASGTCRGSAGQRQRRCRRRACSLGSNR
jgi:hypothetical protein